LSQDKRVEKQAGQTGPLTKEDTIVSDIVTLGSVTISIGADVASYIRLSSTLTSTINTRFDSVARRLVMIQGDTHQMDIRLTKLELGK
jgi:hypothetical protein